MDKVKKYNWLLLRGWAREKIHWHQFPEMLEKTKFTQNVHCLDLLGSGEFKDSSIPLSTKEFIQELRPKALDFINQSGECAILAISLGSMVALNWYSLFPKDFQKLVLINPSFRNLSPIWKRLMLNSLPQLGHILASSKPFERELKILNLTTSILSEKEKTQIATLYADHAQKNPPNKLQVLKQLLLASQLSAPAMKGNHKNILTLNSSQDQLVGHECSEHLAQFLNCSLKTHPRAGHDLPLDDPAWVLERIEDFLTTIE